MCDKPAVERKWTTTVTPHRKFFNINLLELWDYRDLILLFVRRDFVVKYKQTILGPLWFVIQPLFTTLVFTVVFSKIARIPTDGAPPMLFYLAGLLGWNYFATCLTSTSTTFITNAGIFGKVYFPRLAVPISVVISNIFTFAIQLVLFMAFYIYFITKGAPIKPNIWIIALPLLTVQIGALGLGVGIWVSALTTRYRDLQQAVGFATQLWMYATPVVYPASIVPDKWQWLLWLNPMTSVVEVFKHSLLSSGSIPLNYVFLGLASTFLILISGILVFSKVERTFMDTV